MAGRFYYVNFPLFCSVGRFHLNEFTHGEAYPLLDYVFLPFGVIHSISPEEPSWPTVLHSR